MCLNVFPLGILADALLDGPALVIINEDSLEGTEITEICKLIRNNEDNSAVPIIVLTSNTSLDHELELLKGEIEYCIKKPTSFEALALTIKNIVKLIITNRGISPLTKLPRKYTNTSRAKKASTKKARICCTIFWLR